MTNGQTTNQSDRCAFNIWPSAQPYYHESIWEREFRFQMDADAEETVARDRACEAQALADHEHAFEACIEGE